MGWAGLGGEARAGSSSGHAARIRVAERASIPSCAWPCASATAGGVRHRIGGGLRRLPDNVGPLWTIRTLGRLGAGAGFHHDPAVRLSGEEAEQLRACELPSQHRLTLRRSAVQLKVPLRDVDADDTDHLFHAPSLVVRTHPVCVLLTRARWDPGRGASTPHRSKCSASLAGGRPPRPSSAATSSRMRRNSGRRSRVAAGYGPKTQSAEIEQRELARRIP